MNSDLPNDDALVQYYDSDYPSTLDSCSPYGSEATKGVTFTPDIERFRAIAADAGEPILDLCCGTGRVSLPLAADGHSVVGVDVSEGMLKQFRAKLAEEAAAVAGRIELFQQDVRRMALPCTGFSAAVCAFNSFLCIASFDGQKQALEMAGAHLARGGVLVLDLVNPFRRRVEGDPITKPLFTRRNLTTGNFYTRFAASGPFDIEQCQRLHGWYDEVDEVGLVHRAYYSIDWRPIYLKELDLMFERAGLVLELVEGGYNHEPFRTDSDVMLVVGRKL